MTFQLENITITLATFLKLSSKDPLKNLFVFRHICDKSFTDYAFLTPMIPLGEKMPLLEKKTVCSIFNCSQLVNIITKLVLLKY